MSNNLFRIEAIQQRGHRAFGSIRVPRNRRGTAVTIVALAMAGLVLAFLFVGELSQKATVRGQLVPAMGLSSVPSPIHGVLSSLLVHEGDQVNMGDPLAIIVADTQTESGSTQDALAASIRDRRAGLNDQLSALASVIGDQQRGLLARVQSAQDELSQANAELATAAARAKLAEETTAQFRRLKADGHISALLLQEKESELLAIAAEWRQMQRLVSQSKGKLSEAQQQLAEHPARNAAQRSELQNQLAQLDQEEAEISSRGGRVLKAPISGVVSSQQTRVGQYLSSHQIVMTLVPQDATLEAQLLVPSRSIGFIDVGKPVKVRYQAFPYQKFGHQSGTVVRVSRSALSSSELGEQLPEYSGDDHFYRVVVALQSQTLKAYGKSEALRPGMLLDADILLDRRTLVEWILEPLYSLHGRMESST